MRIRFDTKLMGQEIDALRTRLAALRSLRNSVKNLRDFVPDDSLNRAERAKREFEFWGVIDWQMRDAEIAVFCGLAPHIVRRMRMRYGKLFRQANA